MATSGEKYTPYSTPSLSFSAHISLSCPHEEGINSRKSVRQPRLLTRDAFLKSDLAGWSVVGPVISTMK